MGTPFKIGDKVSTPWRLPLTAEIVNGPLTEKGERIWGLRWPDLAYLDWVRERILQIVRE